MISEAEQKFIKYLKNEPTHRLTPERFEVLQAAIMYQGHFAADDLYLLMKRKRSHVSRATVYNTLELLEKCNLLTRRNFGDKVTRYESKTIRDNHDHLVCSNCGRIVEFNNSKLNKIISEIADENGYEFSDYSLNLFVKCKDAKNCKRTSSR
jgi:Fur family ferric uptake transcriptional regulator